MENRWYERGKQWFTTRFRRLIYRSNTLEESKEEQEDHRFISRVTSKLKSSSSHDPRRRFALRLVAFCLLLGMAYGLWQGAQHMVERDMLAGFDKSLQGEASSAVELADRVGNSWVTREPQLMVSSVLRDVYEERREHVEAISVQATMPERLDLTQAVWPVIGTLQGGYGWYREQVNQEWRFRDGLTIIPDREEAIIRSSLPGKIDTIRTQENGYEVVVVHPEGWTTEYTGIDELFVELGDVVQAGERIGASYSAVRDSGVFFAVKNESGPIDPTSILHVPLHANNQLET